MGFIEPHRLPYPEPSWPGALPRDASFPGPALEPDASLGVEVPGYLRDTEGTRRELAGLQGAVRHVDAQVGRILAALKQSGLESQTLVVFTTDHGIAMPRAKCSLYEPGVQVALILRLPGRKGYDLAKDPFEQSDLAARPQQAAVRAELLERLRRHLVETEDPILAGAIASPHHQRAMELLKASAVE